MTPEQILIQVIVEAGKMFASSPKMASATARLLETGSQTPMDWRLYLLIILCLASVLWIAGRLRGSEEKQTKALIDLEKRVEQHFVSCDKVKRTEIGDYVQVKLATAKLLNVTEREHRKYARYLFDSNVKAEDIPDE